MKSASQKAISPLEPIRDWLGGDMARMEQELGRIITSDLDLAQKAIVELHRAGGKRIRPLLTILVSKIADDTPVSDQTIRLAAIVEALHLITLIHDDVIDEAQIRRHHQSLNFTYGNRFAVLVGDFAYARLHRTLVDHFSHRIMDYMADLVVEICQGALAENIASHKLALGEVEYFRFLNGKTASLFGAALALSTLANDDGRDLDAWENLGREFGMAYQIVDDILDFLGKEELGKGRFRDLPNGKVTLPVIHLLGSNDGKAATLVESIIAGDSAQHGNLIDTLEQNGSFEYAYLEANRRAENALSILSQLPPTAGTERMAEIIRWLPIRIK